MDHTDLEQLIQDALNKKFFASARRIAAEIEDVHRRDYWFERIDQVVFEYQERRTLPQECPHTRQSFLILTRTVEHVRVSNPEEV